MEKSEAEPQHPPPPYQYSPPPAYPGTNPVHPSQPLTVLQQPAQQYQQQQQQPVHMVIIQQTATCPSCGVSFILYTT